jgi:hypothetical protein
VYRLLSRALDLAGCHHLTGSVLYQQEGSSLSLTRLIRLAGLLSVVAAALIVLTEIVGFIVGGASTDPVALANGMLRVLAFFFLLLGLVGLYACQSEAAGRLGLVGFLLAFLGSMLITGDLWFEAFAFPYFVEVVPSGVLEGGKPGGTFIAGAGVSFLTFNFGWLGVWDRQLQGGRLPPCRNRRAGSRSVDLLPLATLPPEVGCAGRGCGVDGPTPSEDAGRQAEQPSRVS